MTIWKIITAIGILGGLFVMVYWGLIFLSEVGGWLKEKFERFVNDGRGGQ